MYTYMHIRMQRKMKLTGVSELLHKFSLTRCDYIDVAAILAQQLGTTKRIARHGS